VVVHKCQEFETKKVCLVAAAAAAACSLFSQIEFRDSGTIQGIALKYRIFLSGK